MLALQIWAKEYNGKNNWFALPKETQNKILKKSYMATNINILKPHQEIYNGTINLRRIKNIHSELAKSF